MLSAPLVVGASFAYLLLLFSVAHFGDRRARQGRSVIGNAWIYALSMGVYCTAWTYFGSIGRAASSGIWFLPIYLGPTLAMLLADKKEFGRAIELQNKALGLQPANAGLRLNLAKIYIRSGNKARAKVELESLAKLGEKFPSNAEVITLLNTL